MYHVCTLSDRFPGVVKSNYEYEQKSVVVDEKRCLMDKNKTNNRNRIPKLNVTFEFHEKE